MSEQPDPSKQAACGRCGKGWDINKQGTVICQCCKLHIHKTCTDLDNEQYKLILDLDKKKKPYFWSCHSCGMAMDRMNACMLDVQIRLDKVESACTELNDKVKKVDELNEKVDGISNEIDSLKKNPNNDQVFHDAVNEMDERLIKKNNVVMHNVPEINAPNVSRKDGFDFDLKQVEMICREINVRFNAYDIKFIIRPGEKRSDGKPRPMIVGFKNSRCRDYLYDSSYKLKKTRLSEIRVVADLTRFQRDKEQALFEECEKRNAELNSDEAAAFLYRVVGQKGQKRIIKSALDQNTPRIGSAQQRFGQLNGSSQQTFRSDQPIVSQGLGQPQPTVSQPEGQMQVDYGTNITQPVGFIPQQQTTTMQQCHIFEIVGKNNYDGK